GRAFRYEQAVDVAPLRGAEGGGADPQPPRGEADLLHARHHGGPGRRRLDPRPVRGRRWGRGGGLMTRGSCLVAFGLIAAILAGSAAVYGSLPDRVPIHWNIRGEVDGYGSRTLAAFLMPAVLLGVFGLLWGIPRLVPAQFESQSFRSTYGYIVV